MHEEATKATKATSLKKSIMKKNNGYLTKNEFAELAGCETKYLSVYIQRGQVTVNEDGLIDLEDERNGYFIAKRNPEFDQDNSLLIMDQKKLELVVQKLEEEVKLLRIKREKIQQGVVPVADIKELLEGYTPHLDKQIKIAIDKIFERFNDIGIQQREIKKYKKELLEDWSFSLKTGLEGALKELELIIDEYSEKRGVGEKR